MNGTPMVNVWKRAKQESKRMSGKAGYKMHEVGSTVDVWLHKQKG